MSSLTKKQTEVRAERQATESREHAWDEYFRNPSLETLARVKAADAAIDDDDDEEF